MACRWKGNRKVAQVTQTLNFLVLQVTYGRLFWEKGNACPREESKLKMAENTGNHNRHTRCEWMLMILSVKCSYFKIHIFVKRTYFVPHTIHGVNVIAHIYALLHLHQQTSTCNIGSIWESFAHNWRGRKQPKWFFFNRRMKIKVVDVTNPLNDSSQKSFWELTIDIDR